MRFLSTLAVAATFVASALAAGPLAFTSFPGSVVTAGKPVELKWTGGDGTTVTITLKKGDPKNLQTVAVITGDATGTSFTWTPSADLPNADDYALSISQGLEAPNYTGLFSLTGGKDQQATVVISGSSTFSFTGVAASTSASASSSASASRNATTTITTTSAVPILTGTAPGASGTGASVSRNTTFSSATLSSTATRSRSASSTGKTSSGSATGSATSTAAAASSSAAAPRAVVVAQGAAFGGLGALVVFMAMF